MNRRITKKLHKINLPDLGIEICQNNQWRSRLVKLEVGDSIAIESSKIPESFYNLKKAVSLGKLNFEVVRVKLSSVPASELYWWEADEKQLFLLFILLNSKSFFCMPLLTNRIL